MQRNEDPEKFLARKLEECLICYTGSKGIQANQFSSEQEPHPRLCLLVLNNLKLILDFFVEKKKEATSCSSSF